MLRREPEKPKRAAPRARAVSAAGPAPDSLTGEDEELFQRLRAWRAATAKELSLPAYVIFHDATLRQIATARPASLPALSKISGVGESKLAKYGPGVIETVTGGASTGAAGTGGTGTGAGPADDDPEWPDEPPDLFD
jgi:ATP-dependent DNA helicase RecQ